MKAAEVHKNKIDYTVKVLEKILGDCKSRLEGYQQELEDMESLAQTEELLSDRHTKNRFFALSVKIAKEEHMKFYLDKEIKELEKDRIAWILKYHLQKKMRNQKKKKLKHEKNCRKINGLWYGLPV